MEIKEMISGLDKKILMIFAADPEKYLSVKDIYGVLGLKSHRVKQLVKEVMTQMKSENILVKTATRYRLHPQYANKDVDSKHLVVGTVQYSPMGSVIVNVDKTDEEICISSENVSSALDGDKVKVYVLPRKKNSRRYGQIVEIISRKRSVFTGIIKKRKHFALVRCASSLPYDIMVHKYDPAIADGCKVIVRISKEKPTANNPVGEIVKVLGLPGENNVEMESILVDNDLHNEFEEKVLKEAAKIPTKILQKEIKLRKDYRNIKTFTIDPSDAKDFDDALSFALLDNGNYQIGVHIADVSHYVQPDSEIDKEAFNRATSVYLVDRTIPMLPEKLCNEVCPLREGEDSLTFSVMFEMTPSAQIVSYSIDKSIINSNKRFTYEQVQAIIEASEYGAFYQPSEYSAQITLLWKLAKILRDARMQNGALKFESTEVKFDLDEEKRPVAVHVKESKQANWLVEEFMLLANKTVAEHIGKAAKKKDIKTFVYRVHDEPNKEKVETFKTFAAKLGYKINDSNRAKLVKSYNDVFDKVKGKAHETLISNIALRTMSKAYYSTDNIGHYGLAFDYYTHFTSPIRRYPDLMVHRLLFDYMNGGESEDKQFYEQCCEHCSQMERKAADAEHESIKYKQAEFLADKIGRGFVGEISGVSKWGIYVMIDENKCEGLVKMTSLKDDFYQLDEENYRIVGLDTGKTYQLGQKVVIKVQSVNLQKKQIDFRLVQNVDPMV